MSHKSFKPGHVLVEVCVDTLASAIAAELGGAGRVELCSALSEGGLTPSAGMVKLAREVLSIPIYVMIRPRTGNFVYSSEEFDVMLYDIGIAKQLGADGIVAGILLPDGTVDVIRTSALVEAAGPLPFTFHRAFDLASDPTKALEDIIGCGCERILSSGQKATASEGSGLIAELVKQAGNRINIMPGSGVNEKNTPSLLAVTGAHEIHLSGRKQISAKSEKDQLNFAEQSSGFNVLHEADALIIAQVVAIANSVQKTCDGD